MMETSVIVNQLACMEAGCPDVELVMTLLRPKPRPKLMFKIFKAAKDLTIDELRAALEKAVAEEKGEPESKAAKHDHDEGAEHGHAEHGHAEHGHKGDCDCGHDHDEHGHDKKEHGHAEHKEHGHKEEHDHGHKEHGHADGHKGDCCGHDHDEHGHKEHEHGHAEHKEHKEHGH